MARYKFLYCIVLYRRYSVPLTTTRYTHIYRTVRDWHIRGGSASIAPRHGQQLGLLLRPRSGFQMPQYLLVVEMNSLAMCYRAPIPDYDTAMMMMRVIIIIMMMMITALIINTERSAQTWHYTVTTQNTAYINTSYIWHWNTSISSYHST